MYIGQHILGSFELAVLVKILLAAAAGGLIGFEREKHGRPAGLRTHLLVAVGACLMMIISEAFYFRYNSLDSGSIVRLDPARVAAQIVTGIGFLGAGVILKEGVAIRGLTTAASLWLVAGLGMAFGAGLTSAGFIATAVALFGLVGLKSLEPHIRKDRYLHLNVSADVEQDLFPQLEELFSENRVKIREFGSTLDYSKGEVEYQFVLTRHQRRIGRELSQQIGRLQGVRRIRFR